MMYVVDVVLFSFCLCACCTVYFIIRWSQKSRKLTKHATFCWRCQMIYCARQCAYIMSLNFQFSFFKWIQFYCFSFAVASHSSSVFFLCVGSCAITIHYTMSYIQLLNILQSFEHRSISKFWLLQYFGVLEIKTETNMFSIITILK